jgi:hypothetical protein
MNLLPERYVERSLNSARSSRVAIVIIATLVVVVAVATHSRLAKNAAVERLVISQSKANSALKLEVDATSLQIRKTKLAHFIERYDNSTNVFPMGGLVATISNLIPESMTLEELTLDIVQTENGKGISGRLSGFATSDDLIAGVVSSLQNHAPFGSVRMDFSRSRTIRGLRARGFRISFLIELDQTWKMSQLTVSVFTGGGE